MDLLDIEEITVNNILFDIKKNVKDVFTDVNTGNKAYNYHPETLGTNDFKIFFLFEVPYHEAFAHWVFESAVFLPFVQYFTKYDNFQILVNKNNIRKYKKSFFKLFQINDANINYIDNTHTYTSNISYRDIPENNISIICRNFILNQIPSSLNDNLITRFRYLLTNFYESIATRFYEKEIENLFLPRSKTENYLPNDRAVDYTSIIKLLHNKKYTSYDTQETDNFLEQIVLLEKSKNIYVNWGSSFYVNGFFSRASTIYVEMNGFTYNCDAPFLLCQVIKSIIEKNNKIVLV
jgi:hypothetical protein